MNKQEIFTKKRRTFKVQNSKKFRQLYGKKKESRIDENINKALQRKGKI